MGKVVNLAGFTAENISRRPIVGFNMQSALTIIIQGAQTTT